MTREKVFGIAKGRLQEYLNAPDAGLSHPDIFEALERCTVEVTKLPAKRLSQSVEFPRTQVRVTGCEKDVNTVFDALLLRFLSAGG